MKKILLYMSALAMVTLSLGRVGAQNSAKAGMPDLAVGSVLLQEAGCELEETTVRVLVYNYGSEAVEGFNVEYTTNFGDTVKEVSDTTVSAAVTSTTPGMVYYDFKTPAKLTPDKVCTVNVKVSLLEGNEMSLTNNQGSASTIGFSTASVPSDFLASSSEFFSSSGLWYYDDLENAMVQETKGKLDQAQPLYTRCIDLEPGTYRVSFVYATGERRLSEDGSVTGIWMDPFEVLVGKVGTLINDWGMIYVDSTSCTQKFFQEAACSFELSEGGSYQFAINLLKGGVAYSSPDGSYYYQWGWAIKVRSFKIEKLEDHKVVASTIFSSLPHSVPADLSDGSYAFTANVKNEGKNKENAYVSFALASDLDSQLDVSDTISLDQEATAPVNVQVTLPQKNVGSFDTVVASIRLVGAENAASDSVSTWKYAYAVTDSVYAYDLVTPERFESGDYAYAGNIANQIEFGLPYTLVKADTLTSITLGLARSLEPVPLKLSIYQWNPVTSELGSRIFSTDFTRSTDPKFMEITLDRPRLLAPGSYMVAIEQKARINASIMFDGEKSGEVWILSGSSGPKKQTDLGYMVARMNFGHTNVKLLEKDMSVLSIDKPTGDGRFSEKEEVSATVMNAGMAEAIYTVYCKVGEQIESIKDTLYAYGSRSVSFNMNLAEAGEHTIQVYTVMEDDENPGNDTITRVVTSLGAPDPYVMDFEYVDDFEYKNLTPWTGVDVDTMYTVGLDGYVFPNEGEKMAFMAMNPVLAGLESVLPAYQGQRYGLCPSSAVDTVPNNDWLMSTRLRLPAEGSSISFAVNTANNAVREKYNVMVSTTNNLITSFQKVGQTMEATGTGSSQGGWAEVTVDLSEYNGKAVYIAIQCVSNSVAQNYTAFMIDDIRVSKASANEDVADLDGYFHLYPNPASERVYITSSGLDMKRIEVFNLTGMRVYSSGDRSGDSVIIPVQGWASGMYMARIITHSGVQTLKFVVR